MLLDCCYDDEPVIPYDFYQRCVDSADDAALCRQVPPLTAALFYCTYTHPFNGPLSRTARVSRYQKGKTSLDFTEARDSEWQWHQLDQSAPRSRQITTLAPHHSTVHTYIQIYIAPKMAQDD